MEFYTGASHFHNYLAPIPEEYPPPQIEPSNVVPSGWLIEG